MKSNKNKTKNKKQRHPLKPLKKKKLFLKWKNLKPSTRGATEVENWWTGFYQLVLLLHLPKLFFPKQRKISDGCVSMEKGTENFKRERERERKVVPWRQSEQHSQGVELLCRRNLVLLRHSSLSLWLTVFFFFLKPLLRFKARLS